MRPSHRRSTAAWLAAAAVAALAVLLLPAVPATAHNSLRSASPAQDARLTTAPNAVTLTFLESLKPAFTTIVVSDSGGRKVAAGEPAITASAVTVPITGTLPNGSYTVAYRVVSADGHPVQGSYRFTVADPAAPAAPATASPSVTPPAASPTTAAAQSSTATGTNPLVIAAIVLAALAVGAVALLRRRVR
ncbi:copper resistance CopC family protein [Micromonospora sp. NPDC004551]|uniref:copper resistance CopC family protein n=1 Tax=Micromonospora sp. NPDC004551 TaxID=3154284 RepID=UPI0033B484BE